MSKNVANGAGWPELLEDGFEVRVWQAPEDEPLAVRRPVDRTAIQFHFNVKGSARLAYHGGSYTLDVPEEYAVLLYNTQSDLPMDARIESGSALVTVIMPIDKFHSLFSHEAGYIPFLDPDRSERKYYSQEAMTPAMSVVLNQMIQHNLNASVRPLYLKAKVYELLALFFHAPEDADLEKCPYLADGENVRKIRWAKDILIERLAEPPTLQELATEVDLPLRRLKEGFKELYGDSVFGFLLDYKMELARKLISEGRYNVNEVGLRLGYSTASHFIAAFKKKFGTTPKKYLTT